MCPATPTLRLSRSIARSYPVKKLLGRTETRGRSVFGLTTPSGLGRRLKGDGSGGFESVARRSVSEGNPSARLGSLACDANTDGESFRGESFRGVSFCGESFRGESFRGESFRGESVGGEAVGAGCVRGGSVRGEGVGG